MIQNFRFISKHIAVPVLSGILFLTGCIPNQRASEGTTAAPFETASGIHESYTEQQLKAQTDFDELMDAVFRENITSSQLNLHFLLRHPSDFGIKRAEQNFMPYDLASLIEDQQDSQNLEEQLSAIDSSLLTDEQLCTLRVLQSYLNIEKKAAGLELYTQPLETTIGVQAQIPILLSEYVFYEKSDVDDYLSILADMDDYYSQILEFEKQKSSAGLMMSDTTIDHIIESCQAYLLVPDDNFLIDTFKTRLEQVPDLTEEERASYLEQNAALIESDFVPAYQILIDGLTALKGTGTNNGGQCGYPDGKKYYEYLVYSATGTSYDSVEKLLTAMEDSMEASLSETASLLKKYPQLTDELNDYKFRQTTPSTIMEELKTLSLPLFPALPECSYTFKDVPKSMELTLSPALYLNSPIDNFQDNTIYINHNPEYSSEDLYPMIAHEGYPGHLYQNVYFHTHCRSRIRMLLSFPGYAEGWATYVEGESYLLDNGLSPELGQLLSANKMALLGLSACLDVYINYLGWDKAQVKAYLSNFGDYSDEIIDSIYATLVETPANYLSYYVGCMEFQNMRKIAEKKLGTNFDLKAFHTFLLDMGTAPFDVIQPYFTSWLMEQSLLNNQKPRH